MNKKIVKLYRVFFNIPDERREICYCPEYNGSYDSMQYKFRIISNINITDCPILIKGEFNENDPDYYCAKFLFSKYFKDDIEIERVFHWNDYYNQYIVDKHRFYPNDYRYEDYINRKEK